MAVDTKEAGHQNSGFASEDRFEIYNLIASHRPSADTGAGTYTASVWTEDRVLDRGAEFARPTGRAAIAGGSSNPEHHRAIEQGIAHFACLPSAYRRWRWPYVAGSQVSTVRSAAIDGMKK